MVTEKCSTYNNKQIIKFIMIFRELIIDVDNFKIVGAQKISEDIIHIKGICIFDVG